MLILTCVFVIVTGEALLPSEEGIFDNYRVKKTLLHSWYVIQSKISVSCTSLIIFIVAFIL